MHLKCGLAGFEMVSNMIVVLAMMCKRGSIKKGFCDFGKGISMLTFFHVIRGLCILCMVFMGLLFLFGFFAGVIGAGGVWSDHGL